MEKRVSRRYDRLVKFLTDTMIAERISLRVRMQAAARLDELFARQEKIQERRETAVERARMPQEQNPGTGGTTDAQSEQGGPVAQQERALADARAFLERVGRKGESEDGQKNN